MGANRTDLTFGEELVRNVGTAYLFDVETGGLLHTLSNPTPDRTDQFGEAVTLSESFAIVGAARDDTANTNSGSVYVFDTTTGTMLRTLDNPDAGRSDQFGNALSLSGDTVLVGASRDDGSSNNTGVAFLFDAPTGKLMQTLNNPSPNSNDRFGSSVAIDGETVLIGASRDDTTGRDSGAAFIYSSADFQVASVPVPSGLPMLGLGLFGLVWVRLRKAG